MASMGYIIKMLRQERHLTRDELAKEIDVSSSVIKKWESDSRRPNVSSQEKICDYFNIDMEYLYGFTPIKNSYRENNIIQIPLFDCTKLDETFNRNALVDTLVLPIFMLKPDVDYFAICIRDNSLLNINIKRGDILVFEKLSHIENNEIGLFIIEGNVVCRIFYSKRKSVRFISINSDYGIYENIKYKYLGKLALSISNRQYDYSIDFSNSAFRI